MHPISKPALQAGIVIQSFFLPCRNDGFKPVMVIIYETKNAPAELEAFKVDLFQFGCFFLHLTDILPDGGHILRFSVDLKILLRPAGRQRKAPDIESKAFFSFKHIK